MEKDFINKIKKTKGLGFILIALVIGVLILLIPENKNSSITDNSFTYHSADEYIHDLENKAAALIESISGVKKCKIMITLEAGYEYYFASDQRIIENEGGKDVQKEYVLTNIDGNQQPLLIEERMPKVMGVAVVCSGINAETEYKIIQMLTALFDVSSHRINVTK
ncbi:hypothetical protein LJB90_00810 [Eubacteriales bacterium OttesenSCG-928-G02]|nr:hypothetical protein [Eubacteriales bacterium OttesenSCG-928-G02]